MAEISEKMMKFAHSMKEILHSKQFPQIPEIKRVDFKKITACECGAGENRGSCVHRWAK